jgi:hypothetical protein
MKTKSTNRTLILTIVLGIAFLSKIYATDFDYPTGPELVVFGAGYDTPPTATYYGTWDQYGGGYSYNSWSIPMTFNGNWGAYSSAITYSTQNDYNPSNAYYYSTWTYLWDGPSAIGIFNQSIGGVTPGDGINENQWYYWSSYYFQGNLVSSGPNTYHILWIPGCSWE